MLLKLSLSGSLAKNVSNHRLISRGFAKISNIILIVKDVSSSMGFYVDAIGLKVKSHSSSTIELHDENGLSFILQVSRNTIIFDTFQFTFFHILIFKITIISKLATLLLI